MRNLPFEFLVRKNKLVSPDAWVWLFQIQAEGDDTFFLTNNNECVTYDGFVYDPFDIEIGELALDLRGDLPEFSLEISNISQELISYIESQTGLVNNTVKAILFNLEDPFAEAYTEDLLVEECDLDLTTINLRLSFFALSPRGFPGLIYSKDFCRWDFLSTECGLDPSVPNPGETCTKRLDGTFGCRYWGDEEEAAFFPRTHPRQFGAFPAIPTGLLYEV